MNPTKELKKKLKYVPVKCPECGQRSDSIKSYLIPDVTFLLLAYRYGWERHVACPKCMREIILKASAVGLIKANLMWPFFWLPFLGITMTRTCIKGHSGNVVTAILSQAQEECK